MKHILCSGGSLKFWEKLSGTVKEEVLRRINNGSVEFSCNELICLLMSFTEGLLIYTNSDLLFSAWKVT